MMHPTVHAIGDYNRSAKAGLEVIAHALDRSSGHVEKRVEHGMKKISGGTARFRHLN
jgi:hypothetical protein